MLIDKSIGDWCDISKDIDDYAYQLYINYMIEKYNEHIFGSQYNFMDSYIKWYDDSLPYLYYKHAEFILRKEKIIKIIKK